VDRPSASTSSTSRCSAPTAALLGRRRSVHWANAACAVWFRAAMRPDAPEPDAFAAPDPLPLARRLSPSPLSGAAALLRRRLRDLAGYSARQRRISRLGHCSRGAGPARNSSRRWVRGAAVGAQPGRVRRRLQRPATMTCVAGSGPTWRRARQGRPAAGGHRGTACLGPRQPLCTRAACRAMAVLPWAGTCD
jgi:hypothetical protein